MKDLKLLLDLGMIKIKTLMYYLERIFPVLVALIFSYNVYSRGVTFTKVPNIGELLAASVNICSILIGFLAVMISIMISITGRRVVKLIRKNNLSHLFSTYFLVAIISGFLAAISSMVFTVLRDHSWENIKLYGFQLDMAVFTFALWIFIISYFVSAAIRIIIQLFLILKMVFDEGEEKSEAEKVYKPDKAKAFRE